MVSAGKTKPTVSYFHARGGLILKGGIQAAWGPFPAEIRGAAGTAPGLRDPLVSELVARLAAHQQPAADCTSLLLLASSITWQIRYRNDPAHSVLGSVIVISELFSSFTPS